MSSTMASFTRSILLIPTVFPSSSAITCPVSTYELSPCSATAPLLLPPVRAPSQWLIRGQPCSVRPHLSAASPGLAPAVSWYRTAIRKRSNVPSRHHETAESLVTASGGRSRRDLHPALARRSLQGGTHCLSRAGHPRGRMV